jgi:hypothetical protein
MHNRGQEREPGQHRQRVDSRRPVDVEQLLVWAIRDQRAYVGDPLPPGVELLPRGHSADGVYAVQRAAALGVRIDEFGAGRLDASQVHPDAETIGAMLARLDPPLQLLMLRHARNASRPDWLPGAVPLEVRPVMVMRKGRMVPKVKYDRNRHPIGYEMETIDRRDEIRRARATYTRWHETLEVLAMALALPGLLVERRATGPEAPARPWEQEPQNGLDTAKIA